jgi:predicted O-methyltransferase YrrM
MNEEFLYRESWFEQKYSPYLGIRFPTLKVALNLFLQRGGELIVETGTMRLPKDWGDGCSTLLLGDFCKHLNKKLITVDLVPENIEVSKKSTLEFKDYIQYVVADSIEFFNRFPGESKIGLLYLDSMDCPVNVPDDYPELAKCQQHNLNELKAALPKLHPDSVILLDDNGFKHGGKPKESKKFLASSGWICVLDSYQSLWIRR